MALQLQITLRAAAQIEKADEWWLENRPSAPDALRNDLKAALAVLVIQPGVGTRLTNTRLEGVRRLHLGRVSYHVFYRVKDDTLVILAFWHTSRRKTPAL